MKIVTQTSVLAKAFGDKEAVRLLAEIGYDGLDYSMFDKFHGDLLDSDNFKEYAVTLRGYADAWNIPFRQAHAPFPTIKFGDDSYNEALRKRIQNAILLSGILGVEQIIVHPITSAEGQKQINLDYFNSLIPFCREAGVKVALENMFDWDNAIDHAIPGACSPAMQFCEYLDELDPEYFVACLDIGHVGLIDYTYANDEKETAQDAIRVLGKDRLKALHIHDNDNHHDLHTLSFTQSLNWNEIMKALRDIDYEGDFTWEADKFLSRFPKELIVDASKFMLKVSEYLIGLSFPE